MAIAIINNALSSYLLKELAMGVIKDLSLGYLIKRPVFHVGDDTIYLVVLIPILYLVSSSRGSLAFTYNESILSHVWHNYVDEIQNKD